MPPLAPDLLIDVLARVGSASSTYLASVKLSCKEWNFASNDDYVLEHLSMDKFTPVPWSNQEANLLARCKESGNPEALYRHGMIEFFSHVKLESGLKNLRRAAMKGHVEACYVFGIILICCGGEEEKRWMEILSSMKSGELKGFVSFRNCRHNVRIFVMGMWVNHRFLEDALLRKEAKTCSCDRRTRKQGWEPNEEDSVCCCIWDQEVKLFCNILMGRS